MAFDITKLVRQSSNHEGMKLWGYETSDNIADVNTSGYADKASDNLTVGDRIFVKAGDGYADMIVVSNSGGVVDLSDGVTVASTDSD